MSMSQTAERTDKSESECSTSMTSPPSTRTAAVEYNPRASFHYRIQRVNRTAALCVCVCMSVSVCVSNKGMRHMQY